MGTTSTKKYYWLKLKDDFFRDKTIKKLRKIAGGDTYTIIYLKLMLLALQDGGKLYFDGVEDSFHEEIALEIDEDSENVRFTLMFLEKTGLLEEVNESEIFLTRMPEMIGSETNKAELMRKKRAQNRMQNGNNVTAELPPVTFCYTEIEIEKEKEIEKDIEIETEIEEKPDDKRPGTPPPLHPVPYEKVKSLFNSLCPSFSRCTVLSEARKKSISARFSSGYSLEDFRTLFEKAEASKFLKGANDRNWRANFDWLIKDQNMAKVLDGNYDDHSQKDGDPKGPGPEQKNARGASFMDLLKGAE